MKKIIMSISIILMIGCTCFLSGCIQEGTVGTGTLRLLITDKPADLDIVYARVNISMIEIHKADSNNDNEDDTNEENFTANANGEYKADIGENITFLGSASGGDEPYTWSWDFGDGNTSNQQNATHNYSTEGIYNVILTVTDNLGAIALDKTIAKIGQEENESDAGWQIIVNKSQIFDLIQLQNVSQLLGEKTNLTAGKYTQIRLTITSAIIGLNISGNTTEYTLDIPSEKIKLINSFWINENETTVLTLDFDIYKSIHKAGNKYIMKPTIKVIEG